MWNPGSLLAALFLAATVLATAPWLPAAAGEDKIRFGTDAASPPLTFVGKDGQLAGFDIDIGNALCRATGVKCEWVVEELEELLDGLDRRRYDAILSSLPIVPELRERVDFTHSYHLQPAAFVAPERVGSIEIGKETVKGKTIGVRAGTRHETFLRDNFSDIASVKPYDLLAQALLDLKADRLDFVFGDRIAIVSTFLQTEQGKGYRLVGPSYTDPKWFGHGAGIAVRKDDTALRLRLNRALRAMRTAGTLKKINDRYFDIDLSGS